jgi:nitroreductase
MTTSRQQEILQTMQFRHACKKFDPSKIISDADFLTILEAARLSPSSFGFEPWKIIVLHDATIKEKLDAVAWGARNSLHGASHFVLLLARKTMDLQPDSPYLTQLMRDVHQLPEAAMQGRQEFYRNFLEHDFHLQEDDRALFDWACKQTYIMLANMMTTAAYLGIDSCPIEGFGQREVDHILIEEGLIDQEHFGVSVMAGFGYRAEDPKREKARQSLEDLVMWV